MANGLSDELKRRLPEIVFSLLAAKQGGPQALGAFQGSVYHARQQQTARDQQAQQQEQARARQEMLDEERRAQAETSEARAQRTETRAEEAAKFSRLQAALGVFDRYGTDVGATATDAPAAESQMLSRGAGLESAFGLPQGQLSPFVPQMSPRILAQKKRLAKEKYAEALKIYGPEALQNDSITIDGGTLLGQIKPSQLMALAEMPTATAAGGQRVPMLTTTPDVPNTPEERLEAALQRGDMATAERIRQSAEMIAGARRRPEDLELAGMNKQLAQMRLEAAQTAKTTTTLPAATQRRVDIKTRAFDQQPVVKRIQMMAESTTFAEGLNTHTTNPADDQALIYAFAKAMDPESVVREGEYATVQKYAQSWAERFGFEARRLFTNTIFLTPDARANMKTTIRSRFAAAKPQYENLRRSYATQISRLTNQGDGDSYLVDYAAGFPNAGEPAAGLPSMNAEEWVRDPNGKLVKRGAR